MKKVYQVTIKDTSDFDRVVYTAMFSDMAKASAAIESQREIARLMNPKWSYAYSYNLTGWDIL